MIDPMDIEARTSIAEVRGYLKGIAAAGIGPGASEAMAAKLDAVDAQISATEAPPSPAPAPAEEAPTPVPDLPRGEFWVPGAKCKLRFKLIGKAGSWVAMWAIDDQVRGDVEPPANWKKKPHQTQAAALEAAIAEVSKTHKHGMRKVEIETWLSEGGGAAILALGDGSDRVEE